MKVVDFNEKKVYNKVTINQTEVNLMEAILKFITGMIQYIQDLVAYFRKKNDGDEDAQMPEFKM